MRQPEHTLVIGTTGAGKSTLVEALLKDTKREIVLTTKPSGFTAQAGYTQVQSLKELGEMILKRWHEPRFRVCLRVRVRPTERDKPIRILSVVSSLISEVQERDRAIGCLRPVGLVVDEIQVFYRHNLPENLDAFSWIISQGREWGVSLIAATQRPTNVPPIFRDNVTNLYVLMLGGDTAVQTVRKLVGGAFKQPAQYRYTLYRAGRFKAEGSTRTPEIAYRMP